ncbi:E3 ubiquitin-protein ligase RNF14-like isoform X2 [Eleginops maclovinus]|uniref:E3 ubiquitin-protein ligase RNF14-like isoform X2 n=1 Tax=Eleginops maclovinus TaxID=56733 RepID=UPI0030804892
MNTDIEEQEDELLALESIFNSEEFVRDESKSAGEIRACVELPADFHVLLKEGHTLRQYEISFLPPLLLTFELPEDYPSCSPPLFALSCSWLTHTQLSTLSAQLTDLYLATGGAVVLFSWVQFLKEDALQFLDIHTLLELPSDEHSTQDPLNAALLEPKNNQPNPKSGTPVSNVSDSCKPHLPALSLEDENPRVFLTDGHDPSYTKRAVNLIQNPSKDSDQNAQASDASEAKQSSEFMADHQNDLSSATEPLDQSEQGAASLPAHSSESPQNEDRMLSGLSLTPSQTLLSQLLIHNVAQKKKIFATTVFDCGVCFEGWLGSDCVQLPECGHIFCRACLGKFCKLQIKEGNVRGVTCPEADCPATPAPAQVKSLVGEELFGRYDHLLLQSTLDCMADVVYCPRTSCGSAVIVEKSNSAALCSVCGFAFCVTCRKTYHGTYECGAKDSTKIQQVQQGTANLPQSQEGLMALWDDYASGSRQRQRLLENRYGRIVMRNTVESYLSEDWIVLNSKNCPHCFCRIQKDRGCNVMTCSKCLNRFCWVCLNRLQLRPMEHFVDSRCTVYNT